ncbi:hypothetical protein FO519_002947 [Halicephalobus sp. NKZ332]|nr:hypothetical protein FO519_002947 [Halicephalobus sp. NKZ332]
MRVERCYFCSSAVWPGHGITFVRNDCTVFQFCRSKCHRLFKKKRNPRKVRWTKASRQARGKELKDDLTQKMEVKRDQPVKITPELVQKTVQIMKEVHTIKHKRYGDLITQKQRAGKRVIRQGLIKKAKTKIHMLRAPVADDESETEGVDVKEEEELMETN